MTQAGRESSGELGAAASELTDSISERIDGIVGSAQSAADAIREQAEAATTRLIAEAQLAVDRDAERIRRDVETRAAQYLAECHRRADAFADARVRRLQELSTELIERTVALRERFDETFEVERQLEMLVGALGQAAEQIVREVKRPAMVLPTVAQLSADPRGRLRAAESPEPQEPTPREGSAGT